MRLPDKVKFLLVLCSGLIFFISGCVDTSVQSIPDSIVYNSQIKLVNLVPASGGGAISGSIANHSYSGLEPGNEFPNSSTPFITIDAGGYNISVQNDSTSFSQSITTETDYKMRFFVTWDSVHVTHLEIDTTVVPNDTSVVLDSILYNYTVIKNTQRYIWQEKGTTEGSGVFPPDTIQIALFNGSPDVSVDGIRLYGGSVDTTADVAVDYKNGSGYLKFGAPAGQYSLDIMSSGSVVTTIGPFSAAPKNRFTAVIYDYSAVVKSNILTDD